MIDTPTALILGAGASSHLKFPLGSGLRDRILNLLRGRDGNGTLLGYAASFEDLFEPFATELSRGGWPSPDAFLEKCPEFIPLGKFLIAFALKEFECPDALFPPNNNGWYGYLGSRLIGDSVDDFRENQLSIITYNYVTVEQTALASKGI